MNSQELCMAILRAESEEAVTAVLEEHLDSVGAIEWRPIDGRETNFNVTTNQAATGGKALTELCTNMVDAILLRKAYEQGIDPESPEAPQSVIEAVKDLVKLRGARSGILAEVDDDAYLREFGEQNLVIGVTAESARGSKPNFTFVDAGEGQRGQDFVNTFLSLSSGRKSKIPFVQGKYNMGSAGVLSYCGRRWYKLIISRPYDRSTHWAWTLVRRRPGSGMPIAEYLVIEGGIPELSVERIRPFVLRSGQEDAKVERQEGTIVKLFSYELGRAADFVRVREELNENLVSTVLPFRLMSFRETPIRTGRRAQGVDERTVSGMEFALRRLDEEAGNDVDQLAGEPLQIADISDPDLGTIRLRAIPLPRKLPGWLNPRRNKMRVYHAVNGQVQFKQTRGYLSQQCRLPGLMDRVIVIVDASDMTEEAHNDIWKGDRETIRQTSVGNMYLDAIQDAIRSSEALKEYQDRVVREETEQLAEEARTDLFQSIVDTDPNIAQLLPGGSVIRLRHRGGDGGGGDWEGRYHPTFVRLVGRTLREEGIEIEMDDRRRVRFETDAANDWLVRPDNRGSVVLRGDGSGQFSIRSALRDGSLSVTIRPVPSAAVIGTDLALELVLHDDGMPLPVSEAIRLRVVEARPHPGPGPRPPIPPTPPGPAPEESEVQQRGLPQPRWLTRDGRELPGRDKPETSERWPDGWTDQDGGTVVALLEDTKVFKINYDNAHFQEFLRKARSAAAKRVVTEQYRMSMLVLMMGFEEALSNMSDPEIRQDIEDYVEEVRRLAARGAATVVMSIARTLPQLITADTVGDPDDD